MNKNLFERIQEILVKYPNIDIVTKRMDWMDDNMDSRKITDDDEWDKLMKEWDDLCSAWHVFTKLKTFDEWKDIDRSVKKGEKSMFRLNGKAVFHFNQTSGESYYCRDNGIFYTPRSPYPKYGSPSDDDFAEQMNYDLGGIGYYQDCGFWRN